MTSDTELLTAFRRGDQKAGEALVEKYFGRVLGFFRNKAPERCNDLAQRTFLGAFEGLERLRDPEQFRRYLFGVACNQLRKYYDESRRHGEVIDYDSRSSADLDPSPSRVAASRQEHRLLLEGLRRIPLNYQIVLELFFWEQMTAAEIGQALEVPLGTVKTRLRKGRQLLAEAIAQLERSPPVRESTVSDLDGWAAQLRDRVRAGRVVS